MRFIPVSHFGGEGEFEKFATSKVAVGPVQTGPLFGNTKFPEVGGVDIYPMTNSLQGVVFVASGSEDTFAKDAVPYAQPFFTRVLQPVDGASTYNFNAGSGGADRIINYVGTDFVSQSINVGTAAHNYKISCMRNPAPYYSGLTTGTSITESFEVGYNGF